MKTQSLMCVASALIAAATATAANVTPTEFANARLRGRTDKNVYKTGETITYTLWLQDMADEVTSGDYSIKYKLFDDDGKSEEGARRITSTNDTFTFTTSLTNPGFSRLNAWVVDSSDNNVVASALYSSGMQVVFNGGAGADIDKLGVTVAEPNDFDTYWAGEIARLNEVPVEETFCEDTGYTVNPALKIYAVGVRCATRHTRPTSAQINDTTNVTGYLCVPVDAETKVPAQLEFRGYGVHTANAPDWWISADRIRFMVFAHGGDLGKGDEYRQTLYNNLRTQDSKGNWYEYAMNPEENADPNTAYFNGMVMRVLRAAQYIKQQAQAGGKCTMWDGTNLISTGGSQGALQATWLAALDHDVTQLRTDINWSCNIGVTMDANAVQPTWYTPWAEGLGYCDEVHFAKRIAKNCEVTITRAGLGDELCPPKGLAAFYNALDTKKSIRWVQGSTHGYEPPAEGRQEFTYSSTFDTTWTGGDGEWFAMDKWSAGHPSAFSIVRLSPSTGGTIALGDTMREAANISDFVNNSTPLVLSAEDGGGLTVTGNWSVCVGRVGHGSLGFNGGDYVLGGNLYAGWYYSGWNTALPPSTGRVDVVNASVTAAYLELGTDHGYGILNVENGLVESTGSISIAAGSGTVGVVTLDDATLTNRNDVYVGSSGRGSVDVPTGSKFAPGTWAWIGQNSTGDGAVKLSGGEFTPGSGVVIGNNGKGLLEIESGDYSAVKDIYMGWNATGEGTLRIKEGASLSGSYVEVGRTSGSKARVEVAGGEWVYNGGNLQIGVGADTEGEVVVTDGGSLSNCNDIYVGQNGKGTLTIESGTVSCNYWLDICRGTNSQSTLNLNGGVLNIGRINSLKGEIGGPVVNWNGGVFKPNGNYEYIFIDDGATDKIAVNVLAGGAILDTNGRNRSIASTLSGEGAFVKRGDEACYIKRAARLGRGVVVEAGSLVFEQGLTSGMTEADPMKEIVVADGATLDLGGSEVYVQGYMLSGVEQAAGTYTAHNGTIHVSAAGAPVAATWTDATGDGDFSNPANWTCYDASGAVVWDALPTAEDTVVTIPYDGEFFDTMGIPAKEIVWSFAGNGTVDFRATGALGDDYSFSDRIAVSGGTLKIASGLSSTLKMAEAWYDPSDADTLTVDADNNVTGIANKGYRGSEMDGVSHSTMPYISDEAADMVNGNHFLVFTNVVGFTSAGMIESTVDQARHLFAVSHRMETKIDDDTSYWEIHPVEIYGGNNYGRMKIEQYGWAYEYSVWAESPEEANYGFWFRPGFDNASEVTAIGHLAAKGTMMGGESYVYQDDAFKLAAVTNECVAQTANANGVYVNYGMRDATPTSNGTYSSGRLGEALVYATDLTDGEIAMVRQYLAAKWLEGGAEMPDVETALPALELYDGAVVDFDGANATIADIAGSGTISNADVTVTDTITITVNSDGTIDPLVIDGSLTLGAGAKLVVKNANKLPAGNALGAITATGGISGAFASVETEPEGVRLRAKVEANDVKIMRRTGLAIIFK